MASIRQLASGRFNVQIRRKKLSSISRTFDTEDEAIAFARTREAGEENAFGRRQDLSFASAGERYCATILKGRPSQKITLYRIGLISSRLPEDMRQITKQDVNGYRLSRLETVASVTCRDELQLIHRIFKWAHRELLLDPKEHPSPCEELAMPPASKPRNRVIRPDELRQLIERLSPVMGEIVELAYETAMRRGEIVKLQCKHLYLEDRIALVIDGKTGDRSVPLSRRALELLRMASERCSCPNDRLYPVTAHAVSTALRRTRNAIGMDADVRMHQLRHSRITMVARKGFNQAQIMMVSGHRDSRSVQRYTHLNVRDVLNLLD
ncbi:tyrosine-type recombinase/integrase [Hoeflea sp. CAU 1731]